MIGKDIIKALLRQPRKKLMRRKDGLMRWLNHDKSKLRLLMLHKTDPEAYEVEVLRCEEKITEGQFTIDVLTEILRSK